jgi:hypothetical protein
MANAKQAKHPAGNTEKDPANWTTGEEPMTGAQKSYLHTLSDEAGVKEDQNLTKGEASQRIEELQKKHTVDSRKSDKPEASNTEKDPRNWATGGEPMTGAQKSYLQTLCEEAGIEFDEKLTKGEASMKIDELRSKNPRTKTAK